MLKFIMQYAGRYKALLFVHIVTYIGFSILDIILPLVQSTYIDSMISNLNFATIVRFAAVMCGLGFFAIIIHFFNNLELTKLQSLISMDIKVDVTKHLHKTPLLQIKKYNPAYLTQRIEDDATSIVAFFISNYIAVFDCALSLIIVGVILFFINYQLLLVVVAVLPLYAAAYLSLRKLLYTRNKALIEQRSAFHNEFNSQYTYIKNIKVSAAYAKSIGSLSSAFEALFNSLLSFSKLSYTYRSLDQLVSVIFQVAIYFLGGLLVLGKKITIGQFIITTSYYSIMLTSIKYYLTLGENYETCKASLHRIQELQEINQENNGAQIIKQVDNITLKDVSFTYEEESIKSPIIVGFSYHFQKDNIYILRGENGSGKSTLIHIILGLHQNLLAGTVYYNDIKLHDIDMYDARRTLIAVLQQDFAYQNQSIGDFFDTNREAVQSFINTNHLNHIYLGDDFYLFDHWEKNINDLSGGERQRTVLLQILMKESDVLILDEPTSAIDFSTTKMLQQMIYRLRHGKITIVITHDSSFEAIADYVVNVGKEMIVA